MKTNPADGMASADPNWKTSLRVALRQLGTHLPPDDDEAWDGEEMLKFEELRESFAGSDGSVVLGLGGRFRTRVFGVAGCLRHLATREGP